MTGEKGVLPDAVVPASLITREAVDPPSEWIELGPIEVATELLGGYRLWRCGEVTIAVTDPEGGRIRTYDLGSLVQALTLAFRRPLPFELADAPSEYDVDGDTIPESQWVDGDPREDGFFRLPGRDVAVRLVCGDTILLDAEKVNALVVAIAMLPVRPSCPSLYGGRDWADA